MVIWPHIIYVCTNVQYKRILNTLLPGTVAQELSGCCTWWHLLHIFHLCCRLNRNSTTSNYANATKWLRCSHTTCCKPKCRICLHCQRIDNCCTCSCRNYLCAGWKRKGYCCCWLNYSSCCWWWWWWRWWGGTTANCK